MRAEDAHAAGVPGYADITGWGISSAGNGRSISGPDGLLLALRRAYERAEADPAHVHLFEGHAAGTAASDAAELTALSALRAGAPHPAALGSIKANIGHTRAAAGVAGLLKAVLAMSAGTLPPTTGCEHPHPLLRATSTVRVLAAPEPWPDGHRLAGVSTMGFGGTNAHLVLCRTNGRGGQRAQQEPAQAAEPAQVAGPAGGQDGSAATRTPTGRGPAEAVPATPMATTAAIGQPNAKATNAGAGEPARDRAWRAFRGGPRTAADPADAPYLPPGTEVYAFSADDPAELATKLSRIAGIARWFSDSERRDLACQEARGASAGRLRAAFAAASAEELAGRAGSAAELVTTLVPGVLCQRSGVFAGDGVRGRVVLLLPGEDHHASQLALRWLDRLGVTAAAAVGHGAGEIIALAWAGCLAEADAAALIAERTRVVNAAAAARTAMLSLSADAATARALAEDTDLVIAAYHGPQAHVLAGTAAAVRTVAERAARCGIPTTRLPVPGVFHYPAAFPPMTSLGVTPRPMLDSITFGPPRRRLVSTVTGRELRPRDDIRWLLRLQLTVPVRFHEAVRSAAPLADLFCEAGPGRMLADLAAQCCNVPAVSVEAGGERTGHDDAAAVCAAALFAAGAAASLETLLRGRAARPVNIWRERVFLTDPCTARPAGDGTSGGPDSPDDQAVPGIDSWIRCFTEVTRPMTGPPAPPARGPWRVRVIGRQPFGKIIREAFADDPRADRVLVFVGSPASPGDPGSAGRLLDAAREALACGRLVVISRGGALAGFCRSLHAEHPGLGVTLLRVRESPDSLWSARPHATADPGVYREIILTDGNQPAVPCIEPVTVTGTGATPLGPADVVLLTGGITGIGLACAEALAGTGAAIGIIGDADPAADPAARAGLHQLRAAGACAGYEPADVTDPAAARTAVARLEERLGPVTALVHASEMNTPRRFADLAADDFLDQLRPMTAGLASALAAMRPGKLRLVVTFGSVAGTYGLAGECHNALASGVLREQAERLARQTPGCRVLHLDWPAWHGMSPPGAAGTAGHGGMAAPARPGGAPGPAMPPGTPIPFTEAGQLLLRLIATAGLPTGLAVHGRLGLPPAAVPSTGAPTAGAPTTGAAAGCPGRFLETVRVHYPGVELVADAALDADTDPYLADYRIDGQAVLPAVLGLEAMAQAASVLAGQPVRQARNVEIVSPVDIPPDGPARIRVCALHRGDAIETVLRSAGDGHRTDHLRAVFPVIGAPQCGDVQVTGGPLDGISAGIVDGTELYGPLCAHAGRFRRVAFLPALTSRSCHALVRGADDTPWFSPRFAHGPLLLGSPGVNDAAIHVLQACLPHRRVVAAGCDSVTAIGLAASGAVEIRARERSATAAEYVWDVQAVDGDGRMIVAWAGLRLRDTGPLRHRRPWPPALLAVYLERGAAALGLGPGLRVTIRAGQPRLVSAGCRSNGSTADTGGHLAHGEEQATDDGGGPGNGGGNGSHGPGNGSHGPGNGSHGPGNGSSDGGYPPRGLWHAVTGPAGRACHSHLDGLILTVEAAGPAACAWAAAQACPDPAVPDVPDGTALRDDLRERCGEPAATVTARIWAAAECLAKAGLPAGSPLVLDQVHDDGWVLLRVGEFAVASAVVAVSGVSGPVTVAIMTAGPGPGPAQADGAEHSGAGSAPGSTPGTGNGEER